MCSSGGSWPGPAARRPVLRQGVARPDPRPEPPTPRQHEQPHAPHCESPPRRRVCSARSSDEQPPARRRQASRVADPCRGEGAAVRLSGTGRGSGAEHHVLEAVAMPPGRAAMKEGEAEPIAAGPAPPPIGRRRGRPRRPAAATTLRERASPRVPCGGPSGASRRRLDRTTEHVLDEESSAPIRRTRRAAR